MAKSLTQQIAEEQHRATLAVAQRPAPVATVSDLRRYAALVTAHARVEAALALVDCDMVDSVCDHDEEPEFKAARAAIRALRHKIARRL